MIGAFVVFGYDNQSTMDQEMKNLLSLSALTALLMFSLSASTLFAAPTEFKTDNIDYQSMDAMPLLASEVAPDTSMYELPSSLVFSDTDADTIQLSAHSGVADSADACFAVVSMGRAIYQVIDNANGFRCSASPLDNAI